MYRNIFKFKKSGVLFGKPCCKHSSFPRFLSKIKSEASMYAHPCSSFCPSYFVWGFATKCLMSPVLTLQLIRRGYFVWLFVFVLK